MLGMDWEPSEENLANGLTREEIIEIVGEESFNETKYWEFVNEETMR
jgi:hypothetical protein